MPTERKRAPRRRLSREYCAARSKLSFGSAFQHFEDLVMIPRMDRHVSRDALDAQRLYAAGRLVQSCLTMRAPAAYNRMSIAHDMAQFLPSAPRGLSWREADRLLFERLLIDELHRLRRGAVHG